MAAHNEPAGGMDFWAAIGVGPENEDEPDETPSQPEAAENGTPASTGATAPGQQGQQDDWAALFSAWDGSGNSAPPAAPQSNGATPKEQTVTDAAAKRASSTVLFKRPETPASAPEPEVPQDTPPAQVSQEVESAQDAEPTHDGAVVQGTEFVQGTESTQGTEFVQDTQFTRDTEFAQDTQFTRDTQFAQDTQFTQDTQFAQDTQFEQDTKPDNSAQVSPDPAPQNARYAPEPAADEAWVTAEQIANTLRPRLPEIWLEVLTRHTHGDEALASKVYNVLNGSHLLGELMRDKNIDEVHVHGTQVTVCGAQGIRQVPGFPNLAASRRAVKTLAATREKTGIIVSKVNDSVVVSRRNGASPNTGGLVSGGVMTGEQVDRIRQALGQMQTVTVTGPAARIVVRALASLIPEGSRVFLGAYAALPAGCVTAASPMEADYVLGVRPGVMAEQMAAARQVGALIANPETKLPAALAFTVTGPSAAPERLLSD